MSRATDDVFQPLQAEDPPTVAGYRLAARLGAGGMGRVYLSHTRGGRPVAIKVVRPELAEQPEFRRRFGREVKAARRVRGAYTAELIDADADGVPPWLATLYVPGPSLKEAVVRSGPLPVPAVLWLMAGVAEALQAIHAEGIVHRDLKPSNVLLATDGPRVIDFGIALAADGTSYTATGGTIGTPAYMSPEQASGDEVTAAADVFALGQTAAFAALGRPLYGDGSGLNMLYRIVHSEPDLSLLPEPLRPLFARCLAADPAARATPAEIVEWCRHRLGADAEAGGGPSVWREITGPDVVVPPPAEAPAVYTQPLTGYPWVPAESPRPTAGERKARRRRAALISAAGVAGGALLVAVLAWSVTEVVHRAGRAIADSPASATGAGSAKGPASGVPDSAARGDTRGARAGTTPSAAVSPREPQPEPYVGISVDARHSISLKDPYAEHTDGKGDIRFGCELTGCELESDTSVFVPLYGKPGATLDLCRLMLKGRKDHRLPLAATADGSEICIKGPSGDIALFVVETKSTAYPPAAFLDGELSIWRGAA